MKVVIVDYNSGNLHSALKAFERAAYEAAITADITLSAEPADVAQADRIVLPGVGAFADCYLGLARVDGMLEALEENVRRKGRPFLGICVGMQLLATTGKEHGNHKGLGWIAGEVRKITPEDPTLKIPHMGWNTLQTTGKNGAHPLLDDLPLGEQGLHAYFVHSYHFVAEAPHNVTAVTDYGGPVTAMVASDNIAGVQFHPEKSQRLGLALIANFLSWKP